MKSMLILATPLLFFSLTYLVSTLFYSPKLPLAFFFLFFYYFDIIALDGALVFLLAKILYKTRAKLRDHINFVAVWKPPVLSLQIISFLAYITRNYSIALYYFFLFLELPFFYLTFRRVHGLSKNKSLVLVLILLPALTIFATPQFFKLVKSFL